MSGVEALARFVRTSVPAVEGCHFCSEVLDDGHRHVARIDEERSLVCACRACYLLFTVRGAAGGRYLSVPDRWMRFARAVDHLPMPVELGFFVWNSEQERVVGIYPGAAGPMEAGIDVALEVDGVEPDVEAVLVHKGEAWVVPVDACYELAGTLKTKWRGFSGGPDVAVAVNEFIARVRDRAKGALA